MKINLKLGLFVVALVSLAHAVKNDDSTPEPTGFPTPSTRPTTTVPDKATTEAIVVPTTTEKKKTTTTTAFPTPTTTTEAPETTTSERPSTTTETPVTTSTQSTSTTSTSTVAPDTTTTPAPTTTTVAPITTPAPPTPPAPVPVPNVGKWEYTSDKNETCVIVQFAVQFNVTYKTTDNKSANILYNLPTNKTHQPVGGDCGNGTEPQNIMLQWGPIGNESSLLLLFSQNNSNEQFELSEIVVEINVATELPNGQKGTLRLYHHKNTFSTPLHMSYHCTKPQTLNLVADDKSSNSTTVAWAHVSHVQLEAFHKQKNTQFSVAKDCDAIDTPDIVPIAVGCALTALVAVVLIAYLVGRRRAQARGYVSM